jgi:hypothetical protein
MFPTDKIKKSFRKNFFQAGPVHLSLQSPGGRELNWLSKLYKTYNIGIDSFYGKYTPDLNGYIYKINIENISDSSLADIEVLILSNDDLNKLKKLIESITKSANNLKEICFLEMVESIVATMETNKDKKDFIFMMQI